MPLPPDLTDEADARQGVRRFCALLREAMPVGSPLAPILWMDSRTSVFSIQCSVFSVQCSVSKDLLYIFISGTGDGELYTTVELTSLFGIVFTFISTSIASPCSSERSTYSVCSRGMVGCSSGSSSTSRSRWTSSLPFATD